jgi:hypothetical protein
MGASGVPRQQSDRFQWNLSGALSGPDTNSVVADCTVTFANWTSVATNTLPPGGKWWFSVPLGAEPHQFYRARLGP